MPDTNTDIVNASLSAGLMRQEASDCVPRALTADCVSPLLTRLGVSAAATRYACGEVILAHTALLLRHRDAAGATLGWESVMPGRNGEAPRYGYTGGAQRGLFRTPLGRCTRLVIADGPLQAMRVATQEGPRCATCYAAAGGAWTEVAEAAVLDLLQRGCVREVALAFGGHEPGRRADLLVRAAIADSGLRVRVAAWEKGQ